jgi:two-component system response regulator GlrR
MPGTPLARTPDIDLEVPYWTQREHMLASLELRYLTQLLENCGGNLSLAARKSRISRVHLYAMLRKHGLGDPKRGA